MNSLLVRLLLLVSIALIPAIGFLVYSETAARHVRQRLMEDEAQRLVRLVRSDQQRIVEGAEQILIAISGAPSVQDNDPNQCPRLMENLLRHAPRYNSVSVIGLDGHQVCARDGFDRTIDMSDRAYFRLALQTGGFVIGEYAVGRISKQPTIHMAQPLRNKEGAVTGVIDIALSLTWLRQQIEHLALPPWASVVIMDRHGTALARARRRTLRRPVPVSQQPHEARPPRPVGPLGPAPAQERPLHRGA
jgi:C4-dicarboxylate-specific signal transduction histidine kinase